MNNKKVWGSKYLPQSHQVYFQLAPLSPFYTSPDIKARSSILVVFKQVVDSSKSKYNPSTHRKSNFYKTMTYVNDIEDF